MRQGEVKVDLIGSIAHPCGWRGTVPLANTGTQVSMTTTRVSGVATVRF